MYPKTLFPETKQVLDNLKNVKLLEDFYLAGGTGLALQLGHRKSVDLDFFAPLFPERNRFFTSLSSFRPTVIQEANNTLDLNIQGVKVSFLEYKYPLLEPLQDFEGV